MDAVLLVGGQGTRLRPLTLTTPKPMLPMGGVPFLAHLLARARAAGVDHAILSTSYQPEVFQGYFGAGEALGLRISYVTEESPLGTGGAIRNVAGKLSGDDFLVFNGDVLSAFDVGALVKAHAAAAADVTLYLTEVEDPRAFGVVALDPAGRVLEFVEKPPEFVSNRINAGCYVMAPQVLDHIPAGRPVSVERETFPGLLAAGLHLHGHVDPSYWLDLGTPEAFVRGATDLVLGRAPSPLLEGRTGPALVLDGAVDASATVTGGTTVGPAASVGPSAVLDGAVVFAGARIGAGAVVRRSAVGAGASVGDGTVIEDAVIGDGAVVGPGNELRHGARVWTGVTLPPSAVRFSSDA